MVGKVLGSRSPLVSWTDQFRLLQHHFLGISNVEGQNIGEDRYQRDEAYLLDSHLRCLKVI